MDDGARDYGYARVSSEAQDLRRQVDELKAAGCDRIVEEKASGKHGAKRPKWEKLVDEKDGQLRRGDRLTVVELSRLGRSTTQLTALLRDFKDRGVGLRILNLGIDTSTPAGELIFTIIAAVGQMERDLIAERTRSALDAKRRRGERVGGRKPKHTPEQVARAMEFLDTTTMTGQEIANAVGMSRSRMYALVARRRAELEGAAT
ncbi:recombinase family protein [Rothia halotolerans]|uniref:recombinase family protein n=1 Tax=Rothia halotolerans TaxID=405770 RepID=UPI00101DBF55|nr:recombinase family protein [Rothia halotolerans]